MQELERKRGRSSFNEKELRPLFYLRSAQKISPEGQVAGSGLVPPWDTAMQKQSPNVDQVNSLEYRHAP